MTAMTNRWLMDERDSAFEYDQFGQDVWDDWDSLCLEFDEVTALLNSCHQDSVPKFAAGVLSCCQRMILHQLLHGRPEPSMKLLAEVLQVDECVTGAVLWVLMKKGYIRVTQSGDYALN